jgi:hypothetical protein
VIDYFFEGLSKVISGGQTGSDQAGLYVAKMFDLETGGHICKGWRTCKGPMPELAEFGLIEHSSSDYPPRTKENAFNADGTVRLASNFRTAGEVLTLKYVRLAKKPHFDVLLDEKNYSEKAKQLAEFIKTNSISILNVAGNADRDDKWFHFDQACDVLIRTFEILKEENLLHRKI